MILVCRLRRRSRRAVIRWVWRILARHYARRPLTPVGNHRRLVHRCLGVAGSLRAGHFRSLDASRPVIAFNTAVTKARISHAEDLT